MSLVGFGSTFVDTNETPLLEYEDGGIWMAYLDGFTLGGGETATLLAYSRVNQDSQLQLYNSASIAGAVPVDPSVLELGPIISSELLDLRAILDAGDATLPWRVEQLGRLSTVPDGEGKQTAVINTEHDLVAVPFGGTFWLIVDVSLMQAGDTVQLRLKAKGGDPTTTSRTTKYATLSDVQTNGIYVLGPLVAHDLASASLKQTAGTGRDFYWKVVRSAP